MPTSVPGPPPAGEPKNEPPFTNPRRTQAKKAEYLPAPPVLPPDKRLAVMRQHGILLDPAMVLAEAQTAKLPLDIACAVLMQESGGGNNEFGHDPTICVGWGTVTHTKYLLYKARRLASRNRLMQGVGPMQLTYYSYQDQADRLGGCWQPRFNLRVGFGLLADHIRQYGLHAGIAAYNGSGPAAQAYANSVLTQAALWEQRFR